MSDGFTCDASLMVENETLKKEVNELTRALGKAYGGEDRLLMCLDSESASFYKEGLGYVTEPTNYTRLSKKIIRQSRRFSKPV